MATSVRKTTLRAAQATARFSANYKARSRKRFAGMVAAGRGDEAFNEVSRLLGINLAGGQRPRIASVCGHKVG